MREVYEFWEGLKALAGKRYVMHKICFSGKSGKMCFSQFSADVQYNILNKVKSRILAINKQEFFLSIIIKCCFIFLIVQTLSLYITFLVINVLIVIYKLLKRN